MDHHPVRRRTRAARFREAIQHYAAAGTMGDLDDGREQKPLRVVEVEDAIMSLLLSQRYDLILTHGLWGEYTRHRRHEEVAKAVVALCQSEQLRDGEKGVMQDADLRRKLGTAGRQHVVENFHYRVVAQRFIQIITEKLGLS